MDKDQSPYISQDWLEAIRGTLLFYPAAGNDTKPFIDAYAPYITKFYFNDLLYTSVRDQHSAASERFQILASRRPPSMLRDAKIRRSPWGWRDLEPSVLTEHLWSDGMRITVHRRRGFGQYALQELQHRSIGVFVHRQDGMGDGGSNMWFLGNRKRRHEPVSNLWDKLSVRLANRAIVVSDGSLTTFKFLRNAANESDDNYTRIYQKGGFTWQQIGHFPVGGYRRTLVWGLTRTS